MATLKDLSDGIEKNTAAVEMLNKTLEQNKKIENEVTSADKSFTEAKNKLFTAMKAVNEATKLGAAEQQKAAATLRDAENGLKKAKEETIAFEKSMELLLKQFEKQKSSIEQINDAHKALTNTIKSAKDSFLKFTLALGVGGFTFLELAKTGMAYNRALFEMSRMQQVAGKDSVELSSALNYVSKNTKLSGIQFAEFAKIVQTGFLGIKPNLIEIAKLSNLMAAQVGPSFEAQKDGMQKLMAIQSKFPALYEQIVGGMKDLASMKEKGGGTDEEKAQMAIMRERILVTQQLTGASQDEQEAALKFLTPVTEAQEKLLKLEEESQSVTKAMDNAKIEFFHTLQPLFIKGAGYATDLLKIFGEYPKTILTIVGSLAAFTILPKTLMAIRSGFILLNSAVKLTTVSLKGMAAAEIATGFGAIAVAIGLIVAAGMAIHENHKKSAEALENQNKEVNDLMSIERDRFGLTAKQRKQYDDLMKTAEKDIHTTEERKIKSAEIVVELKKEAMEAKDVWLQLNKINQDIDTQLGIIQKLNEAWKSQSDAVEKFGDISDEALQGVIDSAMSAAETQTTRVKAIINAIVTSFKGEHIDIPITADMGVEEQMRAIDSVKERYKKVTEGKAGALKIDEKMAILQISMGAMAQKEAAVADAQISKDMSRVRIQEGFTSAYEHRLDTQRKLVESAQFGMGASVEMMQKQVDLAYTLMQTFKKADKDAEKRLMNDKVLSKTQIDQIKNARTQAEAMKVVNSVEWQNADAKKRATYYFKQHNELLDKELQQQQKIYDLTKEIREGYLDAIRSMSTGVGEFSKIIGTQEMGVTQLMDAVDQFSHGALNTMKLGGRQSRRLTEAGLGTGAAIQYKPGGGIVSAITPEEETARARRAYNYGVGPINPNQVGTGMQATEINLQEQRAKNLQDYNKMAGGGQGGSEEENYGLNEEEVAEATEKGVREGSNEVVDAIHELGGMLRNVRPEAFTKPTPGRESNKIPISWATAAVRNSRGSVGDAPSRASSEGETVSYPVGGGEGTGGGSGKDEFSPNEKPLPVGKSPWEEQNEAYEQAIGKDGNSLVNLTHKMNSLQGYLNNFSVRKEAYYRARREAMDLQQTAIKMSEKYESQGTFSPLFEDQVTQSMAEEAQQKSANARQEAMKKQEELRHGNISPPQAEAKQEQLKRLQEQIVYLQEVVRKGRVENPMRKPIVNPKTGKPYGEEDLRNEHLNQVVMGRSYQGSAKPPQGASKIDMLRGSVKGQGFELEEFISKNYGEHGGKVIRQQIEIMKNATTLKETEKAMSFLKSANFKMDKEALSYARDKNKLEKIEREEMKKNVARFLNERDGRHAYTSEKSTGPFWQTKTQGESGEHVSDLKGFSTGGGLKGFNTSGGLKGFNTSGGLGFGGHKISGDWWKSKTPSEEKSHSIRGAGGGGGGGGGSGGEGEQKVTIGLSEEAKQLFKVNQAGY